MDTVPVTMSPFLPYGLFRVSWWTLWDLNPPNRMARPEEVHIYLIFGGDLKPDSDYLFLPVVLGAHRTRPLFYEELR